MNPFQLPDPLVFDSLLTSMETHRFATLAILVLVVLIVSRKDKR
jgi:hypothetical protein